MNNNIELLSPAGNYESFLAAVENGADAVYIGGKIFNARQSAENFDDTEIENTIKYAHARGVKVYLTLNTLISNEEIEKAIEHVKKMYLIGIDALILQDIGFSKLIKKLLPNLSLHASTQMTVYDLEKVKYLKEIGFDRVVLSRELSIEQIKHIAQNSPIEIEVFIHGALCVSYSGQCLMSSMLGARSGNRGKCAQPCRLKYQIGANNKRKIEYKHSGYLLSLKDLCSIDILDQIIESGVKSLKIEGRTKAPEYVAICTKIYRKYIDSPQKYTDEDFIELSQAFNRGGFSNGYLKKMLGRDMISIEKPKNWGVHIGNTISYNKNLKTIKIRLENPLKVGDGVEFWTNSNENVGTTISSIIINGEKVESACEGNIVTLGYIDSKHNILGKVYKTYDKKLNSCAKQSFCGNFSRKVFLSAKLIIKKYQSMCFEVYDDSSNQITVYSEKFVEKALTKALTHDKVYQQIKKTGATFFEFEKIDIELEDDVNISVSEINNIRRTALLKMKEKRENWYDRKITEEVEERQKILLDFTENNPKIEKDIKFSAFFYKFSEDKKLNDLNVFRIYLPIEVLFYKEPRIIIDFYKNKSIEVFVWLPLVLDEKNQELIIKKIKIINIDGVMISNLSQLWIKDIFPNLKTAGDYSLNVFNNAAALEMNRLRLSSITLSLELTLRQIKAFKFFKEIEKEILIYGNMTLMTIKNCTVGSFEGEMEKCQDCKRPCKNNDYLLKDRINKEFPIVCNSLTCSCLVLNSDKFLLIDYIKDIKNSLIDIGRLNFYNESDEEIVNITNLYQEALNLNKQLINNEYINKIKSQGFTKGHYFRGV